MPTPIEKFVADSTRSPMQPAVINEIVNRINAFLNIRISPDGSGKFEWGENGGVFDLSSLSDTIAKKVTESVTTTIVQRLEEVEKRLGAASGRGQCMPGGQIQIEINI